MAQWSWTCWRRYSGRMLMHRLYWHYGVFFVFLLTLWYHVAPAVLEVLKGVASALSASSRMMGLWHPKSKVPAWSSVHSLSVTPPMKLSLSAASEGCPPICRHHQVLRHLMYCSSLLLFLPSFGLVSIIIITVAIWLKSCCREAFCLQNASSRKTRP